MSMTSALAQLILGRVAEVATLFDDDGIIIRFMVRPRCASPAPPCTGTVV
jgi:hypothetical protein